MAKRSSTRLKIFFLLIILQLSYIKKLYSYNYDYEVNTTSRSFSGDVSKTTKYDFSFGITFQQNYFFNFLKYKNGYMVSGFDFNYFKMQNDNTRMNFYQTGLVTSFFFNINKKSNVYQFIRLHGGYNLTTLNSETSNTSTDSGSNLFAGLGFGFGHKFTKYMDIRTFYFFDTHFFQDGYVYINSLNIALVYRYN